MDDRAGFETEKDYMRYCYRSGVGSAEYEFETGVKQYCDFKDCDATCEWEAGYDARMTELKMSV